ncbi:hypothetical protein M1403_04115 [Patescibacteria group bacterium]|nr:hypothetical protein [Patescibacteria group bacterium]
MTKRLIEENDLSLDEMENGSVPGDLIRRLKTDFREPGFPVLPNADLKVTKTGKNEAEALVQKAGNIFVYTGTCRQVFAFLSGPACAYPGEKLPSRKPKKS